MTLCIMACSQEFMGDSRIVVAFDKKVSGGAWSSETEFKMDEIVHEKMMVLFAGSIPRANELIDIYRSQIGADVKFDPEILRKPLHELKSRLVNSLVVNRLGLSYDEFLRRKDQIETTSRSDLMKEIRDFKVDVELLIGGFYVNYKDESKARIFRSWSGDIEPHYNFACIGEGVDSADLTLHRRMQRPNLSVESTVYNIYEAMKLAAISPSVGQEIEIFLLEPKQDDAGGKYTAKLMSPAGKAKLEEYYLQFGPKQARDIEIPRDEFMEFPGQWREFSDLMSGKEL